MTDYEPSISSIKTECEILEEKGRFLEFILYCLIFFLPGSIFFSPWVLLLLFVYLAADMSFLYGPGKK